MTSTGTSSKQATLGDQRRRKEAMELLVMELITDADTEESPDDQSKEKMRKSKADMYTDEQGQREDAAYVYIRSALERGWTHSFIESLHECKKKKEHEIDKICSRSPTPPRHFFFSVNHNPRAPPLPRPLSAALAGTMRVSWTP